MEDKYDLRGHITTCPSLNTKGCPLCYHKEKSLAAEHLFFIQWERYFVFPIVTCLRISCSIKAGLKREVLSGAKLQLVGLQVRLAPVNLGYWSARAPVISLWSCRTMHKIKLTLMNNCVMKMEEGS